ncbi:unnamed protein product [Discosporangium mesarthrocarpum]
MPRLSLRLLALSLGTVYLAPGVLMLNPRPVEFGRWMSYPIVVQPTDRKPSVGRGRSKSALSCRLSETSNAFRTEVNIKPLAANDRLGYSDTFTLLGSCFSENVGQRLSRLKFDTYVNPSHGILFNPLSVASSLERMASGLLYDPDDLIFNKNTGLWCSFDHHSQFSSTDREACIEGINMALEKGSEHLLSSTCIFVTLGTAWAYWHKETGRHVASCHKLPQNLFERRLLPIDKMVTALDTSLTCVAGCNPGARVVFTVSPVRHWREGAVDNCRSKAHLVAAVHKLAELRRGQTQISYFPSYEIINDDLRDYRFYEADMIHPNSVAIDYIWEKLVGAFFSPTAVKTSREVERLLQAKEHRPFNPNSVAHLQFLQEQLKRVEELKQQHKDLDLSQEQAYFSSASDCLAQ